jgi:hypothetical protein
MMMGNGSVDDLNSRMTHKTDERPFRPSIYVHETAPYEENKWQYVKVNDAVFQASIACTRCPMVNNDPDLGVFQKDKPLDVLRKLVEV